MKLLFRLLFWAFVLCRNDHSKYHCLSYSPKINKVQSVYCRRITKKKSDKQIELIRGTNQASEKGEILFFLPLSVSKTMLWGHWLITKFLWTRLQAGTLLALATAEDLTDQLIKIDLKLKSMQDVISAPSHYWRSPPPHSFPLFCPVIVSCSLTPAF